jgi:hypothetical protein
VANATPGEGAVLSGDDPATSLVRLPLVQQRHAQLNSRRLATPSDDRALSLTFVNCCNSFGKHPPLRGTSPGLVAVPDLASYFHCFCWNYSHCETRSSAAGKAYLPQYK